MHVYAYARTHASVYTHTIAIGCIIRSRCCMQAHVQSRGQGCPWPHIKMAPRGCSSERQQIIRIRYILHHRDPCVQYSCHLEVCSRFLACLFRSGTLVLERFWNSLWSLSNASHEAVRAVISSSMLSACAGSNYTPV